MDFKKLAQDKLDQISGFKSNTDDSELDNLLEGLDLEIESVRKIDENQIELDLDDELDFEPVPKSNDQSIQNLFDGYIGEKNFIPNPYEYGPNATYRNVNEGVVYKKNQENLWEAFVKDGKQGQQGPRGFAGGGVGFEEVKRIIASSSISLSGIEDRGTYFEVTKPLQLSNGMLLAPFIQRYISGSPSVSSLSISAGISQRLQLPQGTSYRLWWNGVGPFSYRTGTSAVVALSTDFPAVVGYTQIITTSDTHIAVYGLGGGTLTVEGGDGVL